tara:strand:+ start:164 stop:358 length:195 start_codon:yes stop_codon:yes gene_type:complete
MGKNYEKSKKNDNDDDNDINNLILGLVFGLGIPLLIAIIYFSVRGSFTKKIDSRNLSVAANSLL